MSARAVWVSAPHGSVAGFEAGCRTRAMCPMGSDSDILTCAEAALRRRGDYRLARMPLDQPVPRSGDVEDVATAPGGGVREVHGTPWGYARGCRDPQSCPNRRRGLLTCAESRRLYVHDYVSRRAAGEGPPIAHGTPNGYFSGCRDRRLCPGDADGVSCAEARAQHRRELARAAGVAPRAETLDSGAAAARIRDLRSRGWSLRRIAAATGCGRTTIAELADEGGPVRRRVTADTLQRILAVAAA
jgi:hypothetical protein